MLLYILVFHLFDFILTFFCKLISKANRLIKTVVKGK